ATGRGHGAQRVRPAGADLHPGVAPLAALSPRRQLRLRPRFRRRALRVLPWPRCHARRCAGRAGLALQARACARTRRTVRGPDHGGRGVNTTLPLFPEGQPVDSTAVAADARGPQITQDRRDPHDARPLQAAHPTGLLQQLTRAGALRTLDHALAQSLRRLAPDTPDAVLAAAALASLAVASG